MKRKNFTLSEIVIIIVVIAILATIAIPLYTNAVEKAKAKACETNLRVLLGAVENYALEQDRLPGSLSELRNDDIKKAWADILKKEGAWKIKLAYFLADLDKRGLAYARESWLYRYLGTAQYLMCSANTAGGVSYGINSAVANMSLRDYKNSSNLLVIADADAVVFTRPTYRHKIITFQGIASYALGIKKGGEVYSLGVHCGR